MEYKQLIKDGLADALSIWIQLKMTEKQTKAALDDEELRQLVLIEAEKYGEKTFKYNNADISIKDNRIQAHDEAEEDVLIKRLRQNLEIAERQVALCKEALKNEIEHRYRMQESEFVIDSETGEVVEKKKLTKIVTTKRNISVKL